MNAIQYKLLIDRYCGKCINFQPKGSIKHFPDMFGCHIEAIRSYYTTDPKNFAFCETILDKISKEKGRTHTL